MILVVLLQIFNAFLIATEALSMVKCGRAMIRELLFLSGTGRKGARSGFYIITVSQTGSG
jgi:hypothetical protein